MERLTIRNSDGTVSQPTSTTVEAVFYRLSAYEDTGLEPEQVSELKGFIQGGIHKVDDGWAHVQELLDAEKAGRLVVLPCKVGSVVYAAETTPIIPLHVIAPAVYLDAVYPDDAECADFEMLDNFGKTVFLTREEAERALEGQR